MLGALTGQGERTLSQTPERVRRRNRQCVPVTGPRTSHLRVLSCRFLIFLDTETAHVCEEPGGDD